MATSGFLSGKWLLVYSHMSYSTSAALKPEPQDGHVNGLWAEIQRTSHGSTALSDLEKVLWQMCLQPTTNTSKTHLPYLPEGETCAAALD